MKQWVVHAWDAEGADARALRLRVRESHLEGASELLRNGNFVLGGAMLDADGNMIGSTMIVQFETEAERDAWMSQEPYIQSGVWAKFEIYPFRVANVR